MRLGFYGGTFDPPHRGHLAVAVAAAERFSLDHVLLAPTGRQPLKEDMPRAGFADRLEMVRLLCAEGESAGTLLQASELDAPRADGAANYTVDTLHGLLSGCAEADLFVIVGADSFLDIRRWRNSEELLRMAQWVVVSRPGFRLDDLSALHLATEEMAHVHLLNGVHVDVSATEIRRRLRDGETVEEWLTPEVLRYIRQRGLYV